MGGCPRVKTTRDQSWHSQADSCVSGVGPPAATAGAGVLKSSVLKCATNTNDKIMCVCSDETSRNNG